jgi:uncharacterized protein
MPVIGLLHLEIRVEHARSIKDKRNVVRALKARLRARHNVAVAEIEGNDTLNYALVSAFTISNDRVFSEKVLAAAESDAASNLGGLLASSSTEWIEA